MKISATNLSNVELVKANAVQNQKIAQSKANLAEKKEAPQTFQKKTVSAKISKEALKLLEEESKKINDSDKAAQKDYKKINDNDKTPQKESKKINDNDNAPQKDYRKINDNDKTPQKDNPTEYPQNDYNIKNNETVTSKLNKINAKKAYR